MPAYVDAAGDLLVELPDQRGCVEVREATRSEIVESESMADGWIEARVARHLLVAVGYVAQEGWTILPCGGRVLLRDGRPVRVSDAGHAYATQELIVYDLAVLGWTVTLGAWSVGDEADATAPVTAVSL